MSLYNSIFNEAKKHLEQEEAILLVVNGISEKGALGKQHTAIYIATDRRIILYINKLFGNKIKTFPYSTINSIEFKDTFMFGHNILIFVGKKKYTMKFVQENAEQFTQIVEQKTGKSINSVNPNDIPDHIQKLSELRDKGILTEEEFISKKKELLMKM
jgi:hypothetical protein